MASNGMSAEMEAFVAEEQQRMMFHQWISTVASECFDKCIPTPGRSMSSREGECIKNCAGRFKDTTRFVTQYLVSRGEQANNQGGF